MPYIAFIAIPALFILIPFQDSFRLSTKFFCLWFALVAFKALHGSQLPNLWERSAVGVLLIPFILHSSTLSVVHRPLVRENVLYPWLWQYSCWPPNPVCGIFVLAYTSIIFRYDDHLKNLRVFAPSTFQVSFRSVLLLFSTTRCEEMTRTLRG